MGKKKNGGGGPKNEGEGGKKEDGPITVVLKLDMHCEGCATKIVKSARGLDGVESVKGDFETNKLTVVGKVDPSQIREKLETKAKKKVELISPSPKKDKEGGGGGGGGDKKGDNKPEKKPDEKKSKETPVTTAVLKMSLHCEGCVQKIHRIISKTKGVQTHSIDRQKDLVTVVGTMDAKALAEILNEKLKRPVDIVPPKKEKEKEKGGGEKKEKDGAGDAGKKEEAIAKAEGPRMEYFGHGYMDEPGYVVEHLHAPQMFSDENPNACSIM